MITDAIQSIILLTGGAVGSLVSLHLVGGIGGLFAKLEAVQLESFRHLIRPLNDRDFPWLGTWLALFIGGMRCWCLDQEMAQRVLSAKNLHHARLGTAGAALLKLLPLFIIGTTHRGTSSPHDITPVVLPGMVARVLFEWCRADVSGEAFPAWCSTALDSSHEANKAYPLLVLHEFPHGVKGLMIASFLAAMMSSLSSLFNSVSAMFTYDIYGRCLCHTGQSHYHTISSHLIGCDARRGVKRTRSDKSWPDGRHGPCCPDPSVDPCHRRLQSQSLHHGLRSCRTSRAIHHCRLCLWRLPEKGQQ